MAKQTTKGKPATDSNQNKATAASKSKKKGKAIEQNVGIGDAKSVAFRDPQTVMSYNGTRYHNGNITLEIARAMVKANPVLAVKFVFK